MTRISISTRVFGLAAALGLAVSADAIPAVGPSFLLLCAIAALASVPQPTESARRAVPIVEGALVGLTLAVGGVVSQPVGMYLAVPALMAGLVAGPACTAVTLMAELAMIASAPLVSQHLGLIPETFRDSLPWLLTGLGLGLLGGWIRRLRSTSGAADNAGYASAHRLLDELRLVSRRLSSGLDAVRLANDLLDDCLARVGGGQGAILVPGDGDVFVPLAERWVGGRAGDWDEQLVRQCWESGSFVQTSSRSRGISKSAPAGTSDPLSELGRPFALPVRFSSRTIGVLVLNPSDSAPEGDLAALQELLRERALPLSAALLFEEVRAMATVEERQRLAREIHDGVAQEIASLGYLVDALIPGSRSEDAQAMARLRAELARIVDDLRLSIFDLRSQVSATAGFGSVLADYLREAGARSGTAVHLTLDETPARLRLGHEEQLLRIVQEAVTNARKHSGARNLWVSCRIRPPAAEIVVEDDGRGFDGNGRVEGFGLSIMRERAQRIGAALSLENGAHGGIRVTVRLQSTRDLPPARPDRSSATPTRPAPNGHTREEAVAHA